MVGVVVENNRIGTPVPIRDVVEFERDDREVKAVEPESRGATARKMPNVTWSKAPAEGTMWKRMIQMEARVVGRPFVTNPAVAINVGSVRVAGLIIETLFDGRRRHMLRRCLPRTWRTVLRRRRRSEVPASLGMRLFAAAAFLR